MGYAQKLQYIGAQVTGLGKLLLQGKHDVVDTPLAVNTGHYFTGASVQFDHPFGIEQHMGVLGRLPLKSEVGTQPWN